MKFISFEDADSKLSWTEMADALEAGHKLDRAEIGDLLLSKQDRSLLSRAAWIDGLGIALKSVTVFPENPAKTPPEPTVQGAMLIFGSENGALEAIVDGPLVTKWKTAGDSVLGARLLARKDAATYLVIGAGTVAKSLFQAYSEVFPGLTRFLIWNRTRQKAEQLAEEMQQVGLAVEVADDLAIAVGEADIISTATMAKSPVLRGEWVRPGTHVDLIGAYRPDMREADDDLLLKGSLFVDSRETTIGEIGELIIPMQAGVISADHVKGDFMDLCNGAEGRVSDEEITVFKNGGGAHLDLMTGAMIVRRSGA
ncbi:ornithine cyclodeaminase family protein [Sneathiella chinensis]|uniref:Ornithine cyclodeaminase n=1 Tax=Sneathiella chinensis TaxID=349750 RepID=A0ABQ5U3U6_9PROT|nr:ornithine cyclodeaminase [Sneathiella chinensis]GLQ06584.1 ornithine cyclodeaminase [Sneathiella chinensis]